METSISKLHFFIIPFAERDELRKDIEQLCMQQSGPGYLAVATRMHFQRYKIYIKSMRLSHKINIIGWVCE